jgi:3-hydroxyisobutyrate dehydrogenase-like beta-hydroxyacid dehydrogenase
MSGATRICLIGFGEVGQTLAADLQQRGNGPCTAWDILFPEPTSAPSRAARSGLARACGSAGEAVRDADLVISAVTAAQCIAAASSAGQSLAHGALFLDLNSVAPGTKAEAAAIIDARKGRYVEAAIMSPIGPKRIASPMLLGGPHAAGFIALARELGFACASVYSDTIGRASAAKMCRSVMVKGLEALIAEALLSARHYGVEQTVLESLRDLFPGTDWPTLARYMISRSLIHGRRRAEEMREVARTVRDAGIEPDMSTAAAQRQDWAASYRAAADLEPLAPLLDSILASIGGPAGEERC